MNKKISEFLKKLTISMLLLIFSFVLLTPTANALNYDWRNPPKGQRIDPTGDTDPWDDVKVYDPPPSDDFNILTMLTIFILEKYDYFQYEQMVDTNNRKIIQKQRDERINSKTQNR